MMVVCVFLQCPTSYYPLTFVNRVNTCFYTHLVSLALKLTEKNKAGGCVVGIHGRTLDARRSEWCATLRVNHCILIHAHPLTVCCFSII